MDPQEANAVAAEAPDRTGAQFARDVEEAYFRLKLSRIKRSGPNPNTRASSIGHPCDRFLYYERTQNDLRKKHEPRLQAIFDMGNLDEGYLLRELELAGVEIVQRGRDFMDPRYELSGHIDARVRMQGWRRALNAEVKSLNPFTWDEVNTLEDIRHGSQTWLRKYYDQLQSYLVLSNDDLGLFMLLNKSGGADASEEVRTVGLKVIPCPLDYEYAESVLRKAERVRDAVRAGVEPERLSGIAAGDECPRCAFQHLCCPPMVNSKPVSILDHAEAEAWIAELLALEEDATRYDRVAKMLKEVLPAEEGELLLRRYAVITKKHGRGLRRRYVALPEGT